MRRGYALLVVGALAIGCATPQRTYYEAEKQFGALVQYLVAQKRAGRISDADAAKLTPLIHAGNAAFQDWHDELVRALDEHREPRASALVHATALDVLTQLSAWYAKYQRR
jgi:hypothetical protein